MYGDEWNRLTPEEQHERRREHGTWPARFLKALHFKLHKKQSPEQRMGATGELTRRRRIQLHALELYLSPALVARIRPQFHGFYEDQISLSRYVRHRCDHALPRGVWSLPAGSPRRMTKARLLLVISLVFHPNVSAQIASNIEEFDEIAGVECTEAFIGETGLRDWLKYLLDYTLSGLAAAGRPFLRYNEPVGSRTDDEGNPTDLREGPDPDFLKFLRPFDIEQINLKGTNILKAWKSHPVTRSLSCLEDGQDESRHDPANLGPTWTPATPGNNCVYTSTNENLLLRAWNRPFRPLSREIEQNQTTPRFVNGAITRFSPLREYLWTAFRTHMISLKPPVQELPHLRAPWTARDRKLYRGVLLTQYNSTQPAPAELSHYIVPEGQETA
ncbi:acetylcholinesterase precursor [Colletotrichum asianum]